MIEVSGTVCRGDVLNDWLHVRARRVVGIRWDGAMELEESCSVANKSATDVEYTIHS
jgi:hypothetical protein